MSADQQAWAIDPDSLDWGSFDGGQIGGFRLGPALRRTAFGERVAALSVDGDGVFALELYDRAIRDPGGEALMADLAEVLGVSHRHIATVISAGMVEGVPYAAWRLGLGQVLTDVLDRVRAPTSEFCAGILFSVSEALAFLSDQGSQPGRCSVGGVSTEDIFVGYDGRVLLTGVGLQRARGPETRADLADFASVLGLARAFDATSGSEFSALAVSAGSLRALEQTLRRGHRGPCAERQAIAAAVMRDEFQPEIAVDRAFFGLSPLQ